MGKTKGLYREEYPVGTEIRIAERQALENFMEGWNSHNKLQSEHLEYAGRTGTVKSVGFYHGGDELYVIDGIPGIWHECCLENASEPVSFVYPRPSA
jgi:hypothetical protein